DQDLNNHAPSTSQPPVSPTSRRTTRQESEVSHSRSPTQSLVADEAASTCMDVRYRGATTTVTGLEAGHGSESGELGERLEADQANIWLIKKGGKITEIDQDPGISLVQHDMEFHFNTAEKYVSTAKPDSTAGKAVTTASVAVSTASPTRNTRVSTADDITMAETLVYIRKSAAKYKDIQARFKVDEELAVRLQAEEREQYTEVEKARMLAEFVTPHLGGNARRGEKGNHHNTLVSK
nr:hypothetical protein [Tanacetum cinerariifolium]